MNRVAFTLNGKAVSVEVAPRVHLGDLLRERFRLTATHLGCEHGVCGACTVLIDGAPARSCIALPVTLDGCSVTTLEGLRDDPQMQALMDAFREEHGLQCGFCTPGMLISLRDVLRRRSDVDEEVLAPGAEWQSLPLQPVYQGIVRAALRASHHPSFAEGRGRLRMKSTVLGRRNASACPTVLHDAGIRGP